MASESKCLKCGAPLTPDARDGVCPKCLLAQALPSEPGEEPSDSAPSPPVVTEGPGTIIERYKLLEKIGEGGFGVVYMAEQEEPVRRRVALKIIKLGMDTKEVVARFEAERQALALMDHPHIAKVFDGGATDSGRPYFVMELVRGARITDFCDEHHFSPRQRLELFVQVCQAVQHAHQKGIIHRDLKPSNILVSMNDGVAVPKVIDFGIAKATEQRLTDKMLITRFLQLLGTPAYMSPEQVEFTSLDIDTRSDIYSLGVILYQLLTGHTPFDAQELLQAGVDEMRRRIREDEPPKPSTRLTQDLAATAVGRRTSKGSRPNANPDEGGADSCRRLQDFIRLVRGDLDWIVMKCLEKDRARRYETANGLARDIARHLAQEPVVARPPSPTYRLQKFVRRHRAPVAAAALMASVLVLGTGVSLWQAGEARKERKRAEEKAAAAAAAKAEADRHRLRVEAALDDMQLYHAESLFAEENTPAALAYVASVLRRDRSNRIAAAQAVSALSQCTFALPLIAPIQHEAQVVSARFSLDGRWLLTAAAQSVRVCNAASGQLPYQPLEHPAPVLAAEFTADGQGILTVTSNAVFRWNLSDGRMLHSRTLAGRIRAESPPSTDHGPLPSPSESEHPTEASARSALTAASATISPDERWLAIHSIATVELWNLETGEPVSATLQHEGMINTVAFSPDGELVATASSDHTARLWHTRTGALATEPLRHDGLVESVRFNPDASLVVTTCHDSSVRIWNVRTGDMIVSPLRHGACVPHAEFSPDGQRVVTASLDYTARLWDALTGKPLTRPLIHDAAVMLAYFSPDGRLFVTVARNGLVRLWDGYTGEPLAERLHLDSVVRSARFGPEGRELLTVTADKVVRLWDLHVGGRLPRMLLHSSMIHGASFGPDGSQVVLATHDGTAQIWDVSGTPRLVRALSHDRCLIEAVLDPYGRRVVTASGFGMAHVWDARSGERLAVLPHQDGVHSVRFSPDGEWVATASDDATARVWEAVTGKPLGEPLRHQGTVNWVVFSPDGQRVATASQDRTARVWDARTGKPITGPLRHRGAVVSVQFSPDGTRVLTASLDGTAQVWEASTGRPLGKPLKHQQPLLYAEFSLDGRMIVTASEDKTARVWDAQTGQAIAEPLRHEDWVFQAHFSPDGQRVLTASRDGTVRLWEAHTGHLLALPVKHVQGVTDAMFSPGGQHVMTVGRDRAVRIWDVPDVPFPAPAWLPSLVEALAGQRLTAQRIMEPIPFDELQALRRSLAVTSVLDPFTQWAQWLLADRRTRSISASSPLTVLEYAQLRTAEDTEASLREALLVCPTNGVTLARLAKKALPADEAADPRVLQEADFFSRRAVQWAPANREAWTVRAEVVERQSGLPAALALLRQVQEVQPANPGLWMVAGKLLAMHDQLQEASQAYLQAIELGQANTNLHGALLTEALLNQSQVLRRLGDTKGAAALLGQAELPGLKPVRNPSNDHLYQRIDLVMSWPEAKEYCEQLGGHLATATSREENDFLYQNFAREHVCWLGASDEAEEGAWQWVTGEPWGYTNWFRGEPNNNKGAEHFLALGSHPTLQYRFSAQWNDHEPLGMVAGIAIMHPICEWDSAPPGMAATTPVETPPPVVVTSSGNNEVRVWDLISGQLTPAPRVVRAARAEAGSAPPSPKAVPGHPGLVFTLPLLEGGQLDLAAHLGTNIVVLDFWASWNADCRQSMPMVAEVAQGYRDQGVVLYAVNLGELPESIRAFLEKTGLKVEVALDPDGKVGERYGIEGVPTTIIIGKDGRIQAIHPQTKPDLKDTLKQELESLLAGKVLAEPVEVAAVAPAVAAPAVMPGPDFTTKIPSRDPQAGPDQIDLAPYFNASLKQGWIPPLTPLRLTENCFVQMPQGLLRFRGVPFDVRGLIQLAGQRLNERGGGFPTQVTGIQIGRAGSRLHVLHATAWSSAPGEVVVRYVVHYAGGETQDIPVRFGSDIANWQPAPSESDPSAGVSVIWTEPNRDSPVGGVRHLYLRSWDLDQTNLIESIDFISTVTDSAPFLVALTVENTTRSGAEPLLAKAEQLEAQGAREEAEATVDQCIQQFPADPLPWKFRGTLLARAGQLQEAHEAFTKAVALARAGQGIPGKVFTEVLLARSEVLKSLHRWDEAAADNLAARGIRPRSADVPPERLDLSPFYTSELLEVLGIAPSTNAASALEETVRNQTGLRFDLRGRILLAGGKQSVLRKEQVLTACTNIPVNRKFTRLHILHGTGFYTSDGTTIGTYLLHYADGRTNAYPIVYGRDVRNWWWYNDGQGVSRARLVRTGLKEAAGFKGPVRLYQVTLENKLPELEVTRLDFVSAMTDCAPFLVAVAAIEDSPEDLEYWQTKARLMAEQEDPSAAMKTVDEGIQYFPNDPELWNAKGQLLAKANRLEEALEAMTKALDMANADGGGHSGVKDPLLLSRCDIFRRLNRWSDAGRDYCQAKGYPLRNPEAKPQHIDLSLFYNGGFNRNWHGDMAENNLADLPVGVHSHAGTEFDLRGLIQLRLNSTLFPPQVTNIPVAQVCRKIHFLHAAIEAPRVKDGTPIGRYVMHYANGEQAQMPVTVGRDLGDWFEQPREIGKTFTVAWTGSNLKSRQIDHTKIRLFKSTWTNASPAVAVQSIDLIATDKQAFPFVVAITAEP